MNFSERYCRQVDCKSFGEAAQKKLADAKVLVVGAGGLGTPALQYLVSMGVGLVGISDGDTISLSNLNRQTLYSEMDVGLQKVSVIRRKLALQNTLVDIKDYNFYLTTHNAIELIKQYDVVIDATDNFYARYLINDACVILNKPFVYGAVQQFEGQLGVFNYNGGPTYRCLYPLPPQNEEIPDCNIAGVPGVVPGVIGTYQALEAIKIITGIGQTLSGFISIFDFLNNDHYKIQLKAVPGNRTITKLAGSYEPTISPVQSISPQQLFQWTKAGIKYQLIDVRETAAFEKEHLKDAISYPLSKMELSDDNFLFLIKAPVVLMCEKGNSSKRAFNIISAKNSTLDLYNLVGGLSGWKAEFDTFMLHE